MNKIQKIWLFNRLRHLKILKTLIKIIFLVCVTNPTVSSAKNTSPVGVVPVQVTTHNFYEEFVTIGQCKSEKSKTYYAQINGTIDSVSISEGEKVLKGDIIVSIDSKLAKTQKSRAEASFESAKSDYKKDLSLLSQKVISKNDFDKSTVALEVAKAELEKAKNIYDDMIIKAPHDGYLGVVHVKVGDDIKIGDYLFSLINHGDKIIFAQLPQSLFGKIDKNSDVFGLDANNKKTKGVISAVSNYLNDNGMMTVKLIFPADTNIIHGSYVELQIIFNKHQAYSLPEKAILKNNKGNFVYAISHENTVKQVYIETGIRTDNMIEVISDKLGEGDLVVLEGLTKVFEGSSVKLIDEEK